MKALISKELYQKYSKECDELQEQICEYEDENDIPTKLLTKYRELSSILIEYEKAYHPLPGCVSTLITDEIKLRMEQNHLKQRSLAKMLGMQESSVNDLLMGKNPLNLDVVKKLHTELKISADFLLAHS